MQKNPDLKYKVDVAIKPVLKMKNYNLLPGNIF